MPLAARKTDLHTDPMYPPPVHLPPQPIMSPCAVRTTIEGLPAARVTDMVVCGAAIVKGSTTVYIEGLMAARLGDKSSHGGTIVSVTTMRTWIGG